MPRLTYAYNVARLTPNSAAARRASRYRASPMTNLLLHRFLLSERYLMLIHKSILINILKPTTITTKVRYGPELERRTHERRVWNRLRARPGGCGRRRDPPERS